MFTGQTREIRISREHLSKMVAHAREGRPNEVCGFMGGRDNTVEKLYRMENADSSPVSYSFDSGEQLRAMKELESEGLNMVGIYHSHPEAPAMPSQTDIKRAFFPGTREPNYPGVVYVIVSLMPVEPEVRAYLITEDALKKVEIIAF
jgi:proteasome lid subunit RPN8/RPN11